MPKLKIKPELLSLLTSDEFQEFRSAELVEAYLKLTGTPKLNKKQSRNNLFREVLID